MNTKTNDSKTSKEKNRLDPQSWSSNYREYLIHFALQRVSDYGVAEDLVQETFLSAWKARKRFRGDCQERTWLTGVLRNKIIDLYRKNGRRPSILASDLERTGPESVEGGSNLSWIEQQVDLRTVNEPQRATERHEFIAELEAAVTSLPQKMGEAFRMREIYGYSTEEITRKLNISKSNLWVLIHRAKQVLSDQLQHNWAGYGDRAWVPAA